MMLVNYHPFWKDVHKTVPGLLGNIKHPLYRRQLVGFGGELHSGSYSFKVEPWEIIGVERFHWNGNLQVFLTPDLIHGWTRIGYVRYGTPWQVECYSPKGKIVKVITEADCPSI